MTEPHHDSAAFLEVIEIGANWYVRMTCGCHDGRLVTNPLDTRGDAERALRALDEVHQKLVSNPLPIPAGRLKRGGKPARPDLRKRRERLGLSCKQLADVIDMHRSAISKAELQGIGSPETYEKIEAALSAAEARG